MAKAHPDTLKMHVSKDGAWKVFYASGQRGPVVRSDGSGGVLARGWYRMAVPTGELSGPYSSMGNARDIPGSSRAARQ